MGRVGLGPLSLGTVVVVETTNRSFVLFVLPEILGGYALHPVDFDFDVAPIGHGVGHLVDGLFVHLHTVDGEAGARVQLLVANVTFKMLGLLVLDKDLFVVELAVAVPAPRLQVLLLLASHLAD